MTTRAGTAIAALCILCAIPIAQADEAVASNENRNGAKAAPNPLGGQAVATQTLAHRRAGADSGPSSDMKLNGGVSDNRASNLTTGNNVIADGALSGARGVPLVVQNSGNNVLIQSATIINVQIK